ncbi:MAG: ATP-binding protein [Gammaproteobacteria bacterium]|nr:ATP-binding protein [Gammaproteobacteria bacterium]
MVQIIMGPRQCGKSTLLAHLKPDWQQITLDDLRLRELADRDPQFFLEQFPPPLVINEAQYAPNLFSAIKQWVDQLKLKRLQQSDPIDPALIYMTGSNQIFMDKHVKESLAGRARYYELNTLSVHEILNYAPDTSIKTILFKGGWPELYIDSNISVINYLNDYVRSYVEKDIVLSAGVQKLTEFHTLLGLVAARTGQLCDYTSLANASGIRSVTIKEWCSILARCNIVAFLLPYATNLNKRLIRAPKLYFLDTGLAARLQGWSESQPLLQSPQAGALFETLVFVEIKKYITNFAKDWKLWLWRTKDQEEIDFLIETSPGTVHAFDAKLAIHGARPSRLPPAFQKLFPETKQLNIVSFGGDKLKVSKDCQIIPLTKLVEFLDTLD